MPKILAIVPEDFDLGFKLIGLDTKVSLSPGLAKEYLEKEMASKTYSLIMIEESFLLSFDSRFSKKIQESTSPLIMAIPLKKKFEKEIEPKDYFSKMVRSAIGYEIRLR